MDHDIYLYHLVLFFSSLSSGASFVLVALDDSGEIVVSSHNYVYTHH